MEKQINVRTGRSRAQSTIRAYISQLRKLHLTLFDKPMEDAYWLADTELMFKSIADKKLSTATNILSAAIAGLETIGNQMDGVIEIYRKRISENGGQLFNKSIEQKKSIRENDNWCKLSELQAVANSYKRELNRRKTFTKTPETLQPAERELLKAWLVASLYTIDPVNNPPLRADYAMMQIITKKEYDELLKTDALTGNYLVVKSGHKKFFCLGAYKTLNTYGIKNIPLGSKLNGVLNKFLKLHDKPYLIYNCTQRKPLDTNSFGKLVTRVFEPTGKNVNINLLRHIVISEFDDGPPLKDKIELADKMCHGVGVQATYVKID